MMRNSVLAVLAAGTLSVVTLVASHHFRNIAVERANRALEDAGDAEKLAKELASLQSKVISRVEAEVVSGLAASAQECLRANGLPANALVRVVPLPIKRIGTSSLVEHQTQLSLQNLTLVESATFLDELEVTNRGLLVTDIRYLPQLGEATRSLWTIEITVRLVGTNPSSTATGTAAAHHGALR